LESSECYPPPLKPDSQANFQALSTQLGDSCSAPILEPERSALLQEALADSQLQAVKAQLERRGLGMNADEAQAVQLVGGAQLLIPFGQDAHLVWTRTNGQTAAVGLIRQGQKTLNVRADGQERVVRVLSAQKAEKLVRKLREKSKFQEFEGKLAQKGKRVGKVRVLLDETNKLAIVGIAAEGDEKKIGHQVRIKVKAGKDDEPEDDAEPMIQATACGQATGEAVPTGARMQAQLYDPGEGGDVTGSYNGGDVYVATGSSWVCYEPRPLFEIAPRSLYQLRHLYPNQDDLVGLVGPEANMLLAGFGNSVDSIDLQQFYSQALSATSSAQLPPLPCGLLFSSSYQAICEALNTLLQLLGSIPTQDLNSQLQWIMGWLISNPNGDLLQTVTNLYHPSPTDPALQAYKSFIDSLTQFFMGQGQGQEQARSSAFRAVADAIRLIYEIYSDNGKRLSTLLELNSRTRGLGLITIAQLSQLRGLSLPDPASSPQSNWLRFVIRNNTDMQALIDTIVNGPFANWEQLNDLLRYYYVMAKQALDNGGLATPAGMEGLEGVARATFLLGMAARFLSGAPGVPAGTKFEIFKTIGNVVVDFRVGTWITEGGRPKDTRIFGYMEPFLSKSEVDSLVRKLVNASKAIASFEPNPYGLNVLVLIIDSAEPGALEGLCGAIRARSWGTPVMVISGGRVVCTGGSITLTQQRAVCSILGLCSVDPYVLDKIRSIGKATFVVHVQP
jgi:hypothetical protein